MIKLFLMWNIAVFLIYGIDKFFAIKKRSRIPEKVLILTALLMGGVGAFAGMYLFRHKTRKLKFRIFIPFTLIVSGIYLIWAFYKR